MYGGVKLERIGKDGGEFVRRAVLPNGRNPQEEEEKEDIIQCTVKLFRFSLNYYRVSDTNFGTARTVISLIFISTR